MNQSLGSGLVLLLAVAASSGVAFAQEPVAAVLTTKSGTIGAPPLGKGQIVFFRPGSLIGAALGCTVFDNASQIARLGSGKYYVVTADPGKHAYSTKGERSDNLNLEIEPDETYFVRCNIGAGVMSGSANLSPSDRIAFAVKAKKLSMWKGPKDAAGATSAKELTKTD